MSCDCKEPRVSQANIQIYEKVARQVIGASIPLSNNYASIIQLASTPNTKTGEAEAIIKLLIDATNRYDSQFNKNIEQLLGLVDQVGNSEESAISQFKLLMGDISRNVQNIQMMAVSTQSQLNSLREKTAKELSNLATQINQLAINQANLEMQISLLIGEIDALRKQLNDLNWAWLACISLIFCLWLPKLIQEVGFNKSQKEQELRQKSAALNATRSELYWQRQQQQNLRNDYNKSNALLANITSANSTCTFILGNISGISEVLENIDPEDTPRLLRRLLLVLQQNWDDLINGMRLIAVTLSMDV